MSPAEGPPSQLSAAGFLSRGDNDSITQAPPRGQASEIIPAHLLVSCPVNESKKASTSAATSAAAQLRGCLGEPQQGGGRAVRTQGPKAEPLGTNGRFWKKRDLGTGQQLSHSPLDPKTPNGSRCLTWQLRCSILYRYAWVQVLPQQHLLSHPNVQVLAGTPRQDLSAPSSPAMWAGKSLALAPSCAAGALMAVLASAHLMPGAPVCLGPPLL